MLHPSFPHGSRRVVSLSKSHPRGSWSHCRGTGDGSHLPRLSASLICGPAKVLSFITQLDPAEVEGQRPCQQEFHTTDSTFCSCSFSERPCNFLCRDDQSSLLSFLTWFLSKSFFLFQNTSGFESYYIKSPFFGFDVISGTASG